MRLPLSKVYRAFPELDRFADEECARYLAFRKRMDAGTCTWAALRPALILWSVAIAAGIAAWAITTAPSTGRWIASHDSEILFVSGSLFIVCGAMGTILWRDARLRASLGARLAQDRCGGCGRSILGSPVEFGILRCLGCGATQDLHESGLIAESLLSRDHAMDGQCVPFRRACDHCGGDLLNVSIKHGEVACPACHRCTPVGRLGLKPSDFEARQLIGLMDGKKLIAERSCGGCGYPLQNLTIESGSVTCPECGTRADLASLLYDSGVVIWHAIELGILDKVPEDEAQAPTDRHPTSANPSDSP